MRIAALLILAASALGQDEPAQQTPSGRTLIDREIQSKWADLGLKPAVRSDDAEFLRRIHLDLTGAIPTLEQAEKFLADKSPGRRAKLIEELLASDACAGNWAWIWASGLVGHGDDAGADATIFAVSGQLRALFARNAPLDELARAVIGATGAFERPQGSDAKAVLGMLAEGKGAMTLMYFRWQQTAGRDLPLSLASRFSKAFLGVQIHCAQCHDHPFDRWTQEDFYGMAAFFTNVVVRPLRREGEKEPYGYELEDRPVRARQGGLTIRDSKMGPVKPSWLGTREAPAEGKPLREEFARMLTDRKNVQFARAAVNKMWAHLFGRGIVHPPDDFNGRNKPSHPALLEGLAAEFRARGYDVRWLLREICSSQAYQLSSRAKPRDADREKYCAVAAVRALTPEQIMNSIIAASVTDPGQISLLQRGQILKSFRFAFGDDEGAEIVDFEGTIPAALMMMNSDVIALATRGRPLAQGKREAKPVTRLEDILATRKGDDERLRAIFLSVLSRMPSQKEMSRYLGHVRARGEAGFEDVMWALLNSSEFLFNH